MEIIIDVGLIFTVDFGSIGDVVIINCMVGYMAI